MTAALRADDSVAVVVPTVGRPALAELLASLERAEGPAPDELHLVDDRAEAHDPLPRPSPGTELAARLQVHRTGGIGPAGARNRGWRAASTTWIAFLDDDVVVDPDWCRQLAGDLARAGDRIGGVQGLVQVPLPAHRRPTDWERDVAGLADARWITADMAYRRAALAQAGGFDTGFRRAYREDADLALRVRDRGWALTRGRRRITHPVPPARWSVSLARQAGNADDALMLLRHGRRWRERADVPRGRRSRHMAVTAAGVGAVTAAAAGRRRLAGALAAGWAAGTAELGWARIEPGPRTVREVAAMAATSVAIPPAAVGWWLAGLTRAARRGRAEPASPREVGDGEVAGVLFDRDGTLVADVPYNGDPQRVEPMPGAGQALARLRAAGVATAVISNQSGVARGLVDTGQLAAVNARIEELLGSLGPWRWCPHGPGDACACRKPQPGLVLAAAEALGLDPRACVVVGDIGADVDAARAAGARSVLVPTPATRAEEVAAAPVVASSLGDAVDAILGGRA